MSFVTSYVKGSSLKRSTGTELCFVLPPEERQTGAFEILFQTLEKGSKSLGVSSYGLSDTSLEEVFLKVTEGEDDDSVFHGDDTISLTGPAQRRISSLYDTESLYSVPLERNLVGIDLDFDDATNVAYTNKKEGLSLWIQQFFALLVKRFHHARRGKKGIDCAKPAACSEIQNKYPFASAQQRWNFTSTHAQLPTCSCAKGLQACPKNSYGPAPPMQQLNTKDTLIDLTGRDVNEYLLKSTDEFVKRRYGGITVGDMLKYYPNTNFNANYSSRTASTSRNLSLGFSATGVQLNAKAWFNNKGYHSLPTYLNVLNNAIFRANLKPNQDPREYGIVAYNHPMDFNKEQLGDETLMQGFADLLVSIFVIVALSFVPSSFVVYLVSDRSSKSKHLQLVSGLNPIVYWLANYTWDMINYLIPATSCIIIFLAFNQESYVSATNFPATLCLLLLYGWSMTPLMYPSSFFFDVPSTAYIVLICLNLFIGVVGTISTFILEFFKDDQAMQNINKYLKQVLLIFPNFCLGRGFMDLARNQFTANVFAVFGESKLQDPLSWDVTGKNIFAMFGLLLFMLIHENLWFQLGPQFTINHSNSLPIVIFRPGETEELLPKTEEEDVGKERMRILSEESEENDVLRTINLTKIYKGRFSKKKLLAVDRLSFGLGKGECFGLLGVNGAGKTTTFKMLTGDTSVTAGNAFVGKYSILKDVNKARDQLGYCPQFDAFDELLTAREMLTYYASIRGIRRQFIPQIAEWGISMMDLTLYADKICGDYSGGNKRKLSTSIAFLGNPQLIFLDEPTTGMDPGARRFLWNIIVDIVKTGRSVVFTSHSMEECEALCTRLGIMVNGHFVCFGSPQHLRSKYGDGYTITVRAKLEELTSVDNFMKANFPSSVLKDQHHYMLEYQAPSLNLLLSEVFAKLEILRSTNTITDYSVTQTTLDQIFVNFARKQTEGVELTEDTSLTMHEIQRATTEGERKGVNKYYPPDFDPGKGGLNKYHGTHALRERARKLHEGILIIRFEMPYNIWCNGCGNHIGMGVRYNAQKRKVGNYYTTPIYKFRMKCHLCDQHFEIQTDPKNCEYEILSGARRKEERWDPAVTENIQTTDRDVKAKLVSDAMFKLEHDIIDKQEAKKKAPTLGKLRDMKDIWHDDFSVNQALRRKFRQEKKELHDKTIADDDLKRRALLPSDMPLVEESLEDAELAKRMRYGEGDLRPDLKRNLRKLEIKRSSIFPQQKKPSAVDRKEKLARRIAGIASSSSKTKLADKNLLVSEGVRTMRRDAVGVSDLNNDFNVKTKKSNESVETSDTCTMNSSNREHCVSEIQQPQQQQQQSTELVSDSTTTELLNAAVEIRTNVVNEACDVNRPGKLNSSLVVGYSSSSSGSDNE
eukprot:gene8047-8909_t